MMEFILTGHENHPLRQRRDPRTVLDARVVLQTPAGPLEGWVLNVSGGGVRVLVLDDERSSIIAALATGRVIVCIEGWSDRPARVVWRELREGGAVLGISFDAGVHVDVRST